MQDPFERIWSRRETTLSSLGGMKGGEGGGNAATGKWITAF